MSTMSDNLMLPLPGSWNTTSTMNIIVQFVSQHLEVTNLGWDVATGIYHFLLMYALKYGLYVWIRICSRSDHSIPWWKSLRGTNQAPSPVVEDEVLLRKLELLAEKGWLGIGDAAPALAPVMAMTKEEDGGDDEGCPLGMPISHSLSCSLVLAFQCVLSDEQIYQRADKMRKMFGSTPRVERFERSTIVQTSAWTHEGLLHDAAALVREACEEHPQCTLQVNSWGVFLWDIIGSSTGEVKLVKLRGLHVPVITSASPSPAVGMLEIRGLHLNEADLIAQTHDQSMRLLTKSKSSEGSEELEALSVACPPDVIHQDLHVYASKTVAVNDSLISVQCERVKVVSTNENFSASTDSTTWILAALIMAVPMTQIALSFLYPSAGSSLSILVGQGCGWMLGWLTRRLFTSRSILAFLPSRNASNQGKAPTPIEQDSFEKLELGSSWNRELYLLYLRQGCWLLLVVLLTVLSHWLWTHTGPVYKKWLLAGASTVTVLVTLFKLHAKWRKTKKADTVSRRRYWRNSMSTAITYNDWTHAASMLHFESDVNEAKLYDEAYVQGKLRELQLRRKEGTTDEILFCLRADLIRHLGNMCNRDLHKHRSEVPVVIRDYIKEVRTQLRAVCEMNVDEFSLEEKLTFLTETRQRFGRTALVFSGHVALGTFHSSVFRTLVEHQLLPSVIVGANLGAIVASFATTRTASELRHFFDDPSLPMDFYAKLSTVYVAAYRLRTQDAISYEIEKLEQSMQELLGDLTFEEAFDLSGRILGISVPACPLGHQPAQFLNYLASPHVVIWSAVAVSCVPPNGLLHRPELMIKDRFDRIVPYVPPTKVTFEKAGSQISLETEIPYRQVRELFNVNHFIVSQASPYMAPWLHFKESIQDRSSLAAKLLNLMEMEVRHRCAQLLDMGVTLRGLTSHCAQKWEGDINIILPITFSQATFTLHDDHSPNELRKVAMAGRRCTWAKLSAIHASCGIELMLDEYINELHRRERHAFHQEDNYQDVASPKSSRQSNETITNQSSAPGVSTCTGDELPLEQSTPGYGTPSDVETEDYLLDHLCSCASSNPSSRRCAVAHTVSDQVHLVEECDTIDDSRGAELSSLFGDPAWPGESLHERGDFQTVEGQDEAPSSPALGLESVCEQYKLQSEELQVECEISFEDHVESYDSPKTVLEGPSGRNPLHSRKVKCCYRDWKPLGRKKGQRPWCRRHRFQNVCDLSLCERKRSGTAVDYIGIERDTNWFVLRIVYYD